MYICCVYYWPITLEILLYPITLDWNGATPPVIYRDEIAGCSEKAYDRLSTSDARQMLLFSSDKELLQYVEQVNCVPLSHPPCFSVFW